LLNIVVTIFFEIFHRNKDSVLQREPMDLQIHLKNQVLCDSNKDKGLQLASKIQKTKLVTVHNN